MTSNEEGLSRRDLIKTTGTAAAAAALTSVVPQVYAGESNTIQIALVGCGGRGTGAAANALKTTGGPTRLVAMADLFADRLNPSYADLRREFERKVDVPEPPLPRLRRLPPGDELAGRG